MRINIDKAYKEGLKLLEKHPGRNLRLSEFCELGAIESKYDCVSTAFVVGVRQGYRMGVKDNGKNNG